MRKRVRFGFLILACLTVLLFCTGCDPRYRSGYYDGYYAGQADQYYDDYYYDDGYGYYDG